MQTISRRQTKLDIALDLLADRYRRRLLMALLEHNPQDDDDTQIPATLAIEDDELEQLRRHMTHTHLPKLEKAGVIVWDRESHSISKGPQFDELLPLLQLMYEHVDTLPDEWL